MYILEQSAATEKNESFKDAVGNEAFACGFSNFKIYLTVQSLKI